MKEIFTSIADVIKNRLTNSVYGTFFVCWIVFHWNFLYTLFALDSIIILEKTGLLKNDYLLLYYFDISNWHFWFSWIMPILFTYLIIKWFPKWFLVSAYNCEEKYKTEKKRIKIIEAKIIKTEEANLQFQTAREVEAVAKQKEAEKTIKETDPETEWEKEFLSFKNSRFFSQFKNIIKCIYENRGYLRQVNISTDILVYCDSNNLINIDKSLNSINLTEKGKFFVKRYNDKYPILPTITVASA